MNKRISIVLLSLLLVNVFTAVEISASDYLTLSEIVPTSDYGLFANDIAKFRVVVTNPSSNTEVRTDRVIITTSPQVASFAPITVTLDPGASKTIDLQFQSQTTGQITISALVEGSSAPPKTNNQIHYYNFGTKIDILKSDYYPVGSDNVIKTVSIISNGGGETVEFEVNMKLINTYGTFITLTPDVNVTMSSGEFPPSTMGVSPTYLNMPPGAQATIISSHTLTSTSPTGPWTAEIEVKPRLLQAPVRRSTDTTNVRSPDVKMKLNAVEIYELGQSMKFYIDLQNDSGVTAYIEDLTLKMFDSTQIDKLKGNVVVKMEGQLGTSLYGITIPISETKKISVEIALDKSMIDQFTQSTYWSPNEQYTLKAEANIRGRTSPLVDTKAVSLQPFNPPVRVAVKTPPTFQKDERNIITVILTNTTQNPISNMTVRFGITGPQGEKIVPVPSELIGVNLESSIWGGTTFGNIKEINLEIIPKNEGIHNLEYAFNENLEFNPTPIDFYVSAVPSNHSIQVEPVTLTSNQYVIGAPVTFPITIANRGTFSEYYNAYVEVRSRDGAVFEGRYDISNGNLRPGESTTKNVSIMTTPPNGVGLGEKTAKVYVEYHTTPTITEVPFSVISPPGTTFTAISTEIGTVTVGEQKVMRVTVTNNHEDRRNYNVLITADPNLGFTRSSWGWDVGPGESKVAEFLFQPRSESVGPQVVQIFVNSRPQANAQFLVISKLEAEKKETEGTIFKMTSNTILILVAIVALIVVVVFFMKSRKKVPAGPRPSQQIESRRTRMA